MQVSSVKVEVPGKIMLAGEYAVMDGYPSLSIAINRFLRIDLTTVADGVYEIESDLWSVPIRFTSFSLEKDNSLVHNVMHEVIVWLKVPPVKIKIVSQLDITAGVGSSSALCLGLITACYVLVRKKQFLEISQEEWLQLAKKAYDIQLRRQKQASGYDILTQLYGGVIQFSLNKKYWPGKIVSVSPRCKFINNRIYFFKSDKGAPTTPTLSSTTKWLNSSGKKEWFYALSSKIVELLMDLLSDQASMSTYKRLISMIGEQRRFFYYSPSFPKYIGDYLDKLPGLDHDWTYKTTGAGGEDLILVVADELRLQAVKECLGNLNWEPYHICISSQGIYTNLVEI